MHIVESTTQHLIFDCHPLSHIRMMVELPTPRLILILSLMGLASFSLACTLTSRWPHLIQKYRAHGLFPFGFLPASNAFKWSSVNYRAWVFAFWNLACFLAGVSHQHLPRWAGFLHNITCKLIVSLSLITGLLASYLCCALYLLHTETSSRWSTSSRLISNLICP